MQKYSQATCPNLYIHVSRPNPLITYAKLPP